MIAPAGSVRGMRVLDPDGCPPLEELVAQHVALPEARSGGRAFLRLNMIVSADGGSAVAGVSTGLGNTSDHAVFGALREGADCVLVGMATVVAEQYRAPTTEGLQIYVVTSKNDISGDPELFASGRATLVLPESAGPVPAGVPELRVGKSRVDLAQALEALPGKVVMAEGGPTVAGALVSAGLVDEYFLTVAPRVVGGDSGRVVRGPDADPTPWSLQHGFVDDDGFLFLRYGRSSAATGGA